MRRLFLILMMLASSLVCSLSTAQAQEREMICANTTIPAGWVVVDDFHSSITCGSTFNPQDYNVWVIERISTRLRDDRVAVCYPVRPGTIPPGAVPAGWGVENILNNPFTCGHPPLNQGQNVAIIRCDNCALPTPTPTPTPGPDYEGVFEEASCSAITGWVWNKRAPTTPLRVDIVINGTVFAQVMADQFRQDLQNIGKGDGRHGFRFELPPRLKNSLTNAVNIRVTGTNFLINPNRNFNCPNPIDDPTFFVRQHYIDFLSREPDQGGLNFWTAQITQCGSDPGCIDYMRAQVSKAFFLSIEFQETGYFLTRFYKAAFARMPTLAEFSTDKNILSQGLVVGVPGWENVIAVNKLAYANTFVARSNFTVIYGPLLNSQFVDQVLSNAQIVDQNFRDSLVNGLNTGQLSRAGALRQIVDNAGFFQREFNPAFVMMQYIGYLRRHPSDPPDGPGMPGFFFWLNKLNTQGDQNEMVRAFLLSFEYRNRFGSTDPFPVPNKGEGIGLEWLQPPVPIPVCSDEDGDGYCDDQDCNPYDPNIYPGAPIYCEWGQDRNCNGIDDYVECYWW